MPLRAPNPSLRKEQAEPRTSRILSRGGTKWIGEPGAGSSWVSGALCVEAICVGNVTLVYSWEEPMTAYSSASPVGVGRGHLEPDGDWQIHSQQGSQAAGQATVCPHDMWPTPPK